MADQSRHYSTDGRVSEDDMGVKVTVAYSDDDVIFIENVEELSGNHSPRRVNMNVIICCLKGSVQMEFNGEPIHLCKDELAIAPPNTNIENVLVSSDCECRVLCLTAKITNTLLRPYANVWNSAIYTDKKRKFCVNDINTSAQQKIWPAIKDYLENDKGNPYHKDIMLTILRLALLGLLHVMEENTAQSATDNKSTNMSILHRFLELLNNEGDKRHPVTYYSNLLCLSPKYLSLVCKNTTGKTAKQWIEEYTLENVRYLLKSTDYSIKEIADLLNFPSTSYLGRYVKEHFGMTPMAYRKGAME